jgi:hypothetical protein
LGFLELAHPGCVLTRETSFLEPAMKINAQKAALLSVSGLALCAFLAGVPALAQDNRVDANGMPTTHSTPVEQAATANLNGQADQAASTNTQTVAQAQQGDAKYQAQQQQYQNQLNQAAQQDYQNKSAQYQDQTIAYDQLRARYAAERAAYHRGVWPGRYARWTLDESDANANLVGQRVEILSGDHVGTVEGVAHSPSGHVEALRVRLDNDHMVWIDQADIRYDRGDSIVMTNLDRGDLRQMANESL